ncbi:SURF1-like protein [Frondihabitans sucicola]|uniref:SURF1-like protein n=1 Tax=Frondihabitans sucicola TaxID=1268041 RepID=A0ABM8GLS6_9MICO|nr:SURF1 family cytochrome oxidase biogenesis protein [Frondihabitans sucicola]BDZ49142.1 SURF1-like protein [Frondihabitans sucicola]
MHDTATRPGPELPETMWEVARRPRWIGMLVFALAVAALFAYLGHWQLDRSVESLKPVNTGSETRKVLSDVTEPQTEFLDKMTGQKVSVTGSFAPSDFTVLSGRIQQGKTGYWLVGRFVDSTDQSSLVVALGWGTTRAEAREAIPSIPLAPTVETLSGRYLPTEAADDGKFTQGLQTVVSVPQLINQWSNFSGDVYNGYVVDHRGWGGLTPIYSPAPIDKATLNWLNVFYAVEWVVFAGFAIFLWFRLVRDAFERETEEAEEEAALLAASPPTPTRTE